MSVAVDIAGNTVRVLDGGNSQGRECRIHYGLVGVPPRVSRDSFIWNRPKAARLSHLIPSITLADAWNALFAEDPGSAKWLYDSGDTGTSGLVELIGDAVAQIAPGSRHSKTVVVVDDHLPEERQELLLQSLAAAGITDVDLLWRPVSIVLSCLESCPQESFADGDTLLVVDSESARPEVTSIELKDHRGSIVPLRSLPATETGSFGWGGAPLRQRIAEEVSGGDAGLVRQLLAGPSARDFIAFTEGRQCADVWCRRGATHSCVRLSAEAPREARDRCIGEALGHPSAQLRTRAEKSGSSALLWHGWPFRSDLGSRGVEGGVVLRGDAAVMGAHLYAERLLSGEPTYLDTLPGLYIRSEVKELRTHAYFPLVVAGVQEGGRTWRLPNPLTRFSVAKDVSDFSAVLRRSDDPQCRLVKTPIPTPSEDTPVIIRGEMKPAHGRAKVTIEGTQGHEGVFGDTRVVTLDWKRMTPIDDPLVTAPEVYPIRGRLFDDPEYSQVLQGFLESDASVYTKVWYRGHQVPFWKLMLPWGYSPPWHSGQGKPAGWDEEPTRGMFGSEYVECDTDVLHQLAKRIEKTAKANDKPKLLNYMFVYSPEGFHNLLRKKFQMNMPTLESFNWVFAPGRVFSSGADFEIFMDFMLRISGGGYPAYPNGNYTQCYWWSFFRCFCYHADSIQVPQSKVLEVLRLIAHHVESTGAKGNVAKYCLCAILFSLRMRTRFPDFLQPGSQPFTEVVDCIHNLPSLKYPPAMLDKVNDPTGEGLNGLVMRFLFQTASKKDLAALEGLTTSMT